MTRKIYYGISLESVAKLILPRANCASLKEKPRSTFCQHYFKPLQQELPVKEIVNIAGCCTELIWKDALNHLLRRSHNFAMT